MGFPSLNLFGLQFQQKSDTKLKPSSAPTTNCALWLNGLNGSEKRQLEDNLKAALRDEYGISAIVIDGDLLQEELSATLGYCHTDQRENMRRVAEVAKLLVDSGVFTIVSCRSPLADSRKIVKELLAPNQCIEVFVNSPLTLCESRNIKRLCQQNGATHRGALNTESQSFNPRDDEPDFQIETPYIGVKKSTRMIVDYLEEKTLRKS